MIHHFILHKENEGLKKHVMYSLSDSELSVTTLHLTAGLKHDKHARSHSRMVRQHLIFILLTGAQR